MTATNQRLQAALKNAGMTVEELADQLQVDPRTVGRWLAGRTPYRKYRPRIAQTLNVTAAELWPPDDADEDDQDDVGNEIADVHIGSDDDGLDWRALVIDAQRRVDMLGLTLAEVIADGDQQLLTAAAGRGCQVRVLMSDRDSVHLAIAEQELGHQTSLTNRSPTTTELDRVVQLLTPHAERREIEMRSFVGAGPYRVLIFDDEMLVHLRIAGIDATASPTLHLRRQGNGGIYDSFSRHFEALWRTGEQLPAH